MTEQKHNIDSAITLKMLIHIKDYLLAVDDSNYYDEYYLNKVDMRIYKRDGGGSIPTVGGVWHKKITHHLPLNNAPVLEGIELLPPLEYVEELAKQNWGNVHRTGVLGFIDGYNKAKEVYKFTEKDICEFVEWMNLHYRALEHTISFKGVKGTKELINLWKKQQPKLPSVFDTETKQYIY
jgi:hypothetical protein